MVLYLIVNSRRQYTLSFIYIRFWYRWKGPTPQADVVAFMNKTYPSDWTYADFANQFRAELYGTYPEMFSYVYIDSPMIYFRSK